MTGKTSLVAKLGNVNQLYGAWEVVRRCSATSKGSDGVTIAQVANAPLPHLSQISSKLLAGSYEFSPLVPCPIEKATGKYRPLQIPTVSDRIVLRATYDVIEPLIRDRVANPCSYGYVKGRSIEDAAEHLLRSVGAGRDWVLESDICGFFDAVDRALLKDELWKLFGSDRMLFGLLEQAVDVSLGDTSHLESEQAAAFPACGCGIPQGGGLSPLFANVYLLTLDETLRQDGFDMVRWADDFVVLCGSEDEAWRAFAAAEQVLGGLKLRLHQPDGGEGKTRVVRYFRGFDFLGLRFGKDGVVPCREKVNEWRKRVGNICKEARSVLGMLTELKRFVQGWLGAYRACRGPRCESLWAALNDELAAAVAKHSNRLGVSIVEADGSIRFLTRMGLPVCGA